MESEEINHGWGLSIISSKCPLLSKNRLIAWHGSNEYSVGWYYGTDIWHCHAPLIENYGSGSYWRNGDEITLIVDCKAYTIKYLLNGKDLGVAIKNFNKLLKSDINDRYYVIISIQHNQNSLTLMDSVIFGDDKKNEKNNIEIIHNNINNNNKWRSIFKPFSKKPKKNKNDLNKKQVRSKSVDIGVLEKQDKNKDIDISIINEELDTKKDEEIKLLRDKLTKTTKISVAVKQKYDDILNKYGDLEKINNRNERELARLKEEVESNKKRNSIKQRKFT